MGLVSVVEDGKPREPPKADGDQRRRRAYTATRRNARNATASPNPGCPGATVPSVAFAVVAVAVAVPVAVGVGVVFAAVSFPTSKNSTA